MFMFRRLKYWLSHTALYATKMVHHRRLDLVLHYAGYSSNVFLLVGLALGLYTRWVHSEDLAVLLFSFLGLFVFGISWALVYYFSMELLGFSLMRLWVGCLLGVIAFSGQAHFQTDSVEETMDFLLVVSLCIRCVWAVLERVLQFVTDTPLVNPLELLEMLGMCVAAVACGKEFLSVTLLICGFGLTLTAIRFKSYLAVINLICVVCISSVVFFPQLLRVSANPFALLCFVGRLALDPLIDLHFCKLTTIERSLPYLATSPLLHKLVILFVTAAEIAFVTVHAKQMPNHKEWYIVVPIFAVFTVVWLCYHIVFIITCWHLCNKLTHCIQTYKSMSSEGRNLSTIMASKGVRHYSLISQRLVLLALILTLIVATIGWQTKSALSLALLSIVVPCQIVVLTLLWELAATLGGTCIGYALVAPVFQHKLGEETSVLPTNALQEMSSQATTTLNYIQRFFSYQLVDTFGCDFSSSGLTMESVESKLKSFFQKSTVDGPRYDTYFVYYSGQVYPNGRWALAGSESLRLETILQWWQELNENSGARLILVLDTKHSNLWLKEVRRISDEHIGLQTCHLTDVVDPETGSTASVGDFTKDWVDYNCGDPSLVKWLDKSRRVSASYAVSRNWTDFTFHLPTEEDMKQHWDNNFPRITKHLIRATNFPKCADVFCLCHCLVRCLRKKKLAWLPPHDLDTGHGFKLVRS